MIYSTGQNPELHIGIFGVISKDKLREEVDKAVDGFLKSNELFENRENVRINLAIAAIDPKERDKGDWGKQ